MKTTSGNLPDDWEAAAQICRKKYRPSVLDANRVDTMEALIPGFRKELEETYIINNREFDNFEQKLKEIASNSKFFRRCMASTFWFVSAIFVFLLIRTFNHAASPNIIDAFNEPFESSMEEIYKFTNDNYIVIGFIAIILPHLINLANSIAKFANKEISEIRRRLSADD